MPAPLTPPECDLRNFDYMPLDVVRLLRSKTWLNALGKPTAGYIMNMWAGSWHQVPAASFENDDAVLAHAAGCSIKKWPRVKAEVMKGWVLCDDGRWYHPVVAEKALKAWAAKIDMDSERNVFRSLQKSKGEKSARARLKTNGKSQPSVNRVSTGGQPTKLEIRKEREELPPRSTEPSELDLLNRESSKHPPTVPPDETHGQPKPPEPIDLPPGFAEWYAAYPRHESKGQAIRAYRKALKSATAEQLLEGARRYARQRAGKTHEFTKLPATWLNGLCWRDEPFVPAAELLKARVIEVCGQQDSRQQLKNLELHYRGDATKALELVERAAAAKNAGQTPNGWLHEWMWEHGENGVAEVGSFD